MSGRIPRIRIELNHHPLRKVSPRLNLLRCSPNPAHPIQLSQSLKHRASRATPYFSASEVLVYDIGPKRKIERKQILPGQSLRINFDVKLGVTFPGSHRLIYSSQLHFRISSSAGPPNLPIISIPRLRDHYSKLPNPTSRAPHQIGPACGSRPLSLLPRAPLDTTSLSGGGEKGRGKEHFLSLLNFAC